jgi:hypothetical protein
MDYPMSLRQPPLVLLIDIRYRRALFRNSLMTERNKQQPKRTDLGARYGALLVEGKLGGFKIRQYGRDISDRLTGM